MKNIDKKNTPNLSDKEWKSFYMAFNGHSCQPDIEFEAENLWFTIAESYKYDSQVSKLIGNQDKLNQFIEKIKGWSNEEKIAVINASNAYWSKTVPLG